MATFSSPGAFWCVVLYEAKAGVSNNTSSDHSEPAAEVLATSCTCFSCQCRGKLSLFQRLKPPSITRNPSSWKTTQTIKEAGKEQQTQASLFRQLMLSTWDKGIVVSCCSFCRRHLTFFKPLQTSRPLYQPGPLNCSRSCRQGPKATCTEGTRHAHNLGGAA